MDEFEYKHDMDAIEAIIRQMEDVEDNDIEMHNLKMEEQELQHELQVLREIDKAEDNRRQSLHKKRASRQ